MPWQNEETCYNLRTGKLKASWLSLEQGLFFDYFPATAVTDPDGRFSMTIPEGRFEELFADIHPVRTPRMGVE